MSKPNWVNTSPNSGNGNGSIQVTAQANEGDARQGSVAVASGDHTTLPKHREHQRQTDLHG